MPLAAWLTGLVALFIIPSAVEAQEPGRPGPYVVDLRIVMAGLPQDPGFFPSVPTSTFVPTRSLGFDIGGHVYLLGIGPARVGLGASLARTKGGASPAQPSGARQTSPDVDTTMTTLAPQLSLNFGSSAGWSYVSAGIGQTQITSTASSYASSSSTASTVEETTLELERRQTINVGGGARWFVSTHVAFSFDVRFHMIAARATEEARTPKANTIVAGAGLSFR